jgi:hypothetical protein
MLDRLKAPAGAASDLFDADDSGLLLCEAYFLLGKLIKRYGWDETESIVKATLKARKSAPKVAMMAMIYEIGRQRGWTIGEMARRLALLNRRVSFEYRVCPNNGGTDDAVRKQFYKYLREAGLRTPRPARPKRRA